MTNTCLKCGSEWKSEGSGSECPGCKPESVQLAEPRVCTWSEDDDGNWSTACGNSYCMEAGTPKENEYAYCPTCGARIEYIEHVGVSDDDDDDDEPRGEEPR